MRCTKNRQLLNATPGTAHTPKTAPGRFSLGNLATASFAAALSCSLCPMVQAQDLILDDIADVPTDLHDIDPAPLRRSELDRQENETDEATDTEARPWFGHAPWATWEQATGDWAGHRTALEQRGLTVEAALVWEWARPVSGGVESKWADFALLDIALTADLDTMLGWQNTTAFLDFNSFHGESIAQNVGDSQGFSNLETDDTRDQIAELWIETYLNPNSGPAWRFKAGKVDANSEFAFVEAAELFFHAAAGSSPTVLGLPTSPDPAMGFVVQCLPNDHWSFSAGLFDGANGVDGVRTGVRGPSTAFSDKLSNDWFAITEANGLWDLSRNGDQAKPGRVGVGYWHHSGDWDRFAGGTESGTGGFYVVAEQTLWAPADDEDTHVTAFFQWGQADDAVSEVKQHFAAGLATAGWIPGRPGDQAGLFVSHHDLSTAAGFTDDETVIEACYRLPITESLEWAADVQHVLTPGGDPDAKNAWVIGTRLQLTF